MVMLAWSGIIMAACISIVLVCNKASSPTLQFWQHHTAVSQGYGNDEGFTNLDAAYITAAQHFKDRLLSDWLCAEIDIETPPPVKQHQHALTQIFTSTCIHTGDEQRVLMTPLNHPQLLSVIPWQPLHLTCGKVIQNFHGNEYKE